MPVYAISVFYSKTIPIYDLDAHTHTHTRTRMQAHLHHDVFLCIRDFSRTPSPSPAFLVHVQYTIISNWLLSH